MKRGGGAVGGNCSNGGREPLCSPSSRKVLPPQSPTGLASLSLQEKERNNHNQEFTSTTTFVQVDTSSFRELVQKLTGASDSDVEKLPITLPTRQASRGGGDQSGGGEHRYKMDNTFGGLIPKPVGDLSARRPAFKLHERRQSNLRKLDVKAIGAAAAFRRGVSGYGHGGCSPTSDLSPKFPCIPVSPVTPLTMDVFENAHAPTTPTSYEGYTCLRPKEAVAAPVSSSFQQDAAESKPAERDPHFFLHPSPHFHEKPRQQPELLTLFPLTSPRASETS